VAQADSRPLLDVRSALATDAVALMTTTLVDLCSLDGQGPAPLSITVRVIWCFPVAPGAAHATVTLAPAVNSVLDKEPDEQQQQEQISRS